MSQAPEQDVGALDASSRIVTAVAGDLTPHVAALEVAGPGGRGGGSAVVFTDDRLLLTHAHVGAGGAPAGGWGVSPGGAGPAIASAAPPPLPAVAGPPPRTPPPPPAELGD